MTWHRCGEALNHHRSPECLCGCARSYVVFGVAKDVSAVPNVQASVIKRTVTTKAAGPGA